MSGPGRSAQPRHRGAAAEVSEQAVGEDESGPPPAAAPTARTHVTHEGRDEVLRETVIMILYVSVVLIAELAALPEEHFAGGRVTGAVGARLLAIVWGTALGLAVAHWFAFRLAAVAFRGQRPTRTDTYVGLAQMGGAVLVAAVSSLPVLLLSDLQAQETTGDVPAVVIGVVGYLIARATGRPRLTALVYGATALALGVVVALVKVRLAAH